MTALKIGHLMRINVPVSKLTAPKQATDSRVRACRKIGSLDLWRHAGAALIALRRSRVRLPYLSASRNAYEFRKRHA